jgi:peroxiredoxin
MDLNTAAPDFELQDTEGRLHTLRQYRGRIAVVNFWSCECPHSERTDREVLAMGRKWPEAVALLPVASNRSETREAIAAEARARGLPLMLLDPEHAVADLYQAQTTPHVFVIDQQGVLRYRGAVDDATFRQRVPTHSYLHEALELLLAGKSPGTAETAAYGCAIVREALE